MVRRGDHVPQGDPAIPDGGAGEPRGQRASARALRGRIVSFSGDPFFHPDDEVLTDIVDGLVVVRGGLVEAVGRYDELIGRLDPGTEVSDHSGSIISAGFVDAHVHYVQTPIIASFGEHLIDWLNRYTFPDEELFSDEMHAGRVASLFFDELLRNGTTTALVFCAVYPESVDAFFEEASRRNMRMIAGKVLMDRNAPSAILDTAQSGYDDSKRLIEQWHGVGRNLYAITPRFAPTSTEAQLEAAASLRREYPGTLVHTHVSENVAEIAWVRSLFPDRTGYLDVYDAAGLLGKGTVLAHGVHLTAAEWKRCAETGTAIVHCPTSNLFLGSGLFHVHQAKNPKHPVTVGLGTDIGAGTRFSLLETMGDAYKVAELTSYPLDAVKMFYLATLGGAEALGVADRIGSIEVGKEADLVVLDPEASALLAYRSHEISSVAEQLFLFAIMGDDRAVTATYVAGELAYERSRDPSRWISQP
jgi:guanine deaminase